MSALRYAVMPAQCDTCVFGPKPPVGLRRLGEIQNYLIRGTAHLCHKPATVGKKQKLACRGGRDWQLTMWYRMGILPEATDAALEAMMVAMAQKESSMPDTQPKPRKPRTGETDKGGQAVKAKYGPEFFREIGRKGGAVIKERGTEYLAKIGKAGGEVTKARHGSEHYAEIGRKGGQNGRGIRKPGAGRKPV